MSENDRRDYYEVRIVPTNGQAKTLLSTDSGPDNASVRDVVRRAVGQLMRKHLYSGGNVVVENVGRGENVLTVIVMPAKEG
jgi:hypothetical protein